MKRLIISSWAVVAMGVALHLSPTGVVAQVWPDIFDPATHLNLNFTMDPGDWSTIRNDTTFLIEVPALFNADGETPLAVLVRRKSGDNLNGKVSLKVDVNDLVSGQKWHGVTKLSLENGDDTDVVSEGLAWYMHRQAAAALGAGADYAPGLASWVNVNVNGVGQGVYLNVEQPNKQFLRNRELYTAGETWLYKQTGVDPEIKVGDPDSPTFNTLNYSPFKILNPAPTPDDATLATDLSALIDMEGMLTLGAINAFTTNPDDLFTAGKNFYYADFLGAPRQYFPWDLDAVMKNTDTSIYGQVMGMSFNQTPYQEIILGNQTLFHDWYNQIMIGLLNGPLAVSSLVSFLDDMEVLLTPFLEADPNNNMDELDVPARFDTLRAWVQLRSDNVRQQVLDDVGLLGLGDGNGDGIVGTADYTIWANNFGMSGVAVPGDYNISGSVDAPDYTIWANNFGATAAAPLAAAASVPEPSTFVLSALGIMGLLAYGWRQRSGSFSSDKAGADNEV